MGKSKITEHELASINGSALKKEIVRRFVLQDIPTGVLLSEIARREEMEEVRALVTNKHTAEVLRICAEYFDLTVSQLLSPRRHQHLADARHVGMFVARKALSLSLMDTARLFYRKDHTSAVHAEHKVNDIARLKSYALDLRATWDNEVEKRKRVQTNRLKVPWPEETDLRTR